ncbi:GntR family transcriptional regulator [Marinobacterium arenosum]|uniref:GntR family transcriptional regulator n=1 Tax=Marinobacterium arenosum TaxID=2862496 RepID=UPI001C938D33|nr:GntR family transcriptional regulator [Marinobacterium arenosum]MBY4677435.1 GntR family transcriptional regulator [Marinobacterium arenosum]
MKKAGLINKRSLEEQAADLLRQDIVNGVLTPGTRLVETTLAKEYGLSRGTIRIALHQLGTEGLVTQVPYAGWSVATLDDQDIWELYTLRATLEGLAARLAAERICQQGVERLQAAYNQLLKLCEGEDLQAITRGDLDLHKTIIELSGHRRLAHQYQLIENQFLSYITAANRTFDPHEVGHSHQALVEAICAGEGERAEAEAVNNITGFEQLQQERAG